MRRQKRKTGRGAKRGNGEKEESRRGGIGKQRMERGREETREDTRK